MFEQARLVQIQPGHLDMILTWRNQEHIRKLMKNSSLITKEEHLHWFSSLSNSSNMISKLFCVRDEPYGVVSFTKQRQEMLKNTWEWGFYIGPSSSPKGTGTLLGYTALETAFHILNMDKIVASIHQHNEKSLRFHQKFGFSYSNTKKENSKDFTCMKLLASEWDIHKVNIRASWQGWPIQQNQS